MRYPDRECRRISALRRRNPELTETLAFLERIAASGHRCEPDTFDPARLTELAGGSPPLLPDRFPLDEVEAGAALRTFLQALAETTESEAAAKALAALKDGRLDAQRLARAYCHSDAATFEWEAKEVKGVDASFLANISELAVKPQFVAAAQALANEFREFSKPASRCPACGSAPELALITDAPGAEGMMLAVCRLCETEWSAHRVSCLFCGNDDTDTLGYLQVEGEEEARVNICELCYRYLPVIDVRMRLEFAPAIERAALVHLDLLAQSRGYRPLGEACGEPRS